MVDLSKLALPAHKRDDNPWIPDTVRTRVADARRQIGALRELQPDNLLRRDLGDASFESQSDRIHEVLRLAREVDLYVLQFVPIDRFNALLQNTRGLSSAVDAMRALALKDNPNVIARRDAIAREFDGHAKEWSGAVSRVLDYQAHYRLQAAAEDAPDQMADAVRRARDTALKQSGEIADILTSVRDQAVDASVGINARYFAGQAKEHSEAARRWLWGAAGSLVAASVWVAYLFFDAKQLTAITSAGSEAPGWAFVQLAVTKAVILSLLATAVVWCGKNYRSHRHNYVVNRHRQNALATFETLAKANADEAVRRALIIEAANSIFSQQPTGYSSSDGGDSPQISTVVDLARGGA